MRVSILLMNQRNNLDAGSSQLCWRGSIPTDVVFGLVLGFARIFSEFVDDFSS